MKVLITGSAGMIGSYVVKEVIAKGGEVVGVDRRENEWKNEKFHQYIVDLTDVDALKSVFDSEMPDRVIHLAALAHTTGETDLSFERYKVINVDCAENVFKLAQANRCSVLFISTVDVIGMVKGIITPNVALDPISNYGKSKAMAEGLLKNICTKWNIYRFSPVYTQDIKRDIEKRYYLKSPKWAYRIGCGGQFEVLDVKGAVASMVDWIDSEATNTIRVIKDKELLDINKLIAAEKVEGRANHVLYFPRWMVVCGFYVLKALLGKCNKTYLIFKALWPFRTIN